VTAAFKLANHIVRAQFIKAKCVVCTLTTALQQQQQQQQQQQIGIKGLHGMHKYLPLRDTQKMLDMQQNTARDCQ
jgi:hypothetical protein